VATTATPILTCEKCHAAGMKPTRIPRFAGVVRLLGLLFMLPSLLGMLLVSGYWLSTVAQTAGGAELSDRARDRALAGLKAIPNLPVPIVSDFEHSGRIIPDDVIRDLPMRQQEAVTAVMSVYTTALATDAVANVAVGGIGFAIVVITFFFGVPSFLIGLLLVSTKKVWRCALCGFVFDRA
jgi:hypothetical protein